MSENKKSAYPTLTEMGVESPKQIDKYYITSVNLVDVLRIVYERPEHSLLPSSRTYKFPRVQENGAAAGEGGISGAVMKTHPKLRSALQELQIVLEAKSSTRTLATDILEEIELLEEDIAMRSETLKVLVNRIPDAI